MEEEKIIIDYDMIIAAKWKYAGSRIHTRSSQRLYKQSGVSYSTLA